ncbi:hypothetical protein [Streptomyces sp. NPDC054765]
MLARELSVSVRTLHRAFAAAEDTGAGYLRRTRLEQARLELLTPKHRPSISELAAPAPRPVRRRRPAATGPAPVEGRRMHPLVPAEAGT